MKKNEHINYLRCIATIFVVFIHASNIFNYLEVDRSNVFMNILFILSNTEVPIFFLISGYLTFSKEKIDYKKHYSKKLKALIVPYIIWTIIYFLLDRVLNMTNLGSDQAQNIFELFIGIPFYTDPVLYEPLWFLRDLILLNILVPLLDKMYKYINNNIIGTVILLIILLPIPLFLFQSLFFVIGGLLARNSKIKSVLHKNINWIIPILLCLVMNVLEFKFQNELISRIAVLIYMYFAYWFAKKTIHLKVPKMIIACITTYSFWIYLTHGKLLSILQIVVSKFAYGNVAVAYLCYFILPIITIGICIFIGKLIKKFVPKIFDMLVGNRS